MALAVQFGTVLQKNVDTSSANPFWIVADVNGDDRPDIFLATCSPFAFQAQPVRSPYTPVQVLLNTPTGFIDGTTTVFGSATPQVIIPTAVKAADFAGDGRLSFFVSDSGLDVSPWPGASQRLFLSTGSGLVDASSGLPNPPEGTAYAHSSAVADIDRNGLPDIFVGSSLAQSDPYFLINLGNGTFTDTRANLPSQYFYSEVLSGSGASVVFDARRYTASALVDVNKDGAPDLILGAADGTRNNLVLLNDGRGDFTKTPAIMLPIALYGAGQTTQNGNTFSVTGTINLKIVPLDLNHDGYSDLVIAETHRNPATGGYVGGRLQVLMNQNGTSFVDATSASLPGIGPTLGLPESDNTYFYDVVADDLYGSGSEDLVVYISSFTSYGTIILRNDGQGHFAKGGPTGLNYDSLLIPIHEPSGELDWASVSYSIYGNTGVISGTGPWGLFNEIVSVARDSNVRRLVHDDAYVILQGGTLSATVSMGVGANDEVPATLALASGPAHGTLQLAADGSLSYAPTAGFSGIDSFAYHASAGNGAAGNAQSLIYVVPLNVGTSTTLDLLALSAEEQIAATYAAFFRRAADAAGFGFWVGEFNRGLPVQGPAALFANIASSFGISAEAKALYPFLVNPFGASDAQISAFLDSVYSNLFNRSSDAGGLVYWTGEIKATLQAGQFVGSVLVNIMSGAQDTAAGKDITTLMGKVAVSLEYVREQQEHPQEHPMVQWIDIAAASGLLHGVTADPLSVLVGIRNAEALIAAHA